MRARCSGPAGRRVSSTRRPAQRWMPAITPRPCMRRQGGGLSIQSFNIQPRIREVDAMLTPAVQDRICEAHPELAFRHLNSGRPLTSRKHTEAGRQERVRLLREVFGERLPDAMTARYVLGGTAVGRRHPRRMRTRSRRVAHPSARGVSRPGDGAAARCAPPAHGDLVLSSVGFGCFAASSYRGTTGARAASNPFGS